MEQRSEDLDVVLSLRGLSEGGSEGAAADAAHTPNLRRSWHVSRGQDAAQEGDNTSTFLSHSFFSILGLLSVFISVRSRRPWLWPV